MGNDNSIGILSGRSPCYYGRSGSSYYGGGGGYYRDSMSNHELPPTQTCNKRTEFSFSARPFNIRIVHEKEDCGRKTCKESGSYQPLESKIISK